MAIAVFALHRRIALMGRLYVALGGVFCNMRTNTGGCRAMRIGKETPMMSEKSKATIDVPDDYLAEWQSIVDLMARIFGVPAGLIMRLNDPDIEVYVASDTEDNPYEVGDKEHFWGSGLYCETVVKSQEKLLVPNALADDKWKDNPDIKLNMISYLGYPIAFPDGKPFGTICVLDKKENAYTEDYIAFLAKMRDLVQSQLALVYMNKMLKDENLRLADYISEIKTLRGIIPICAHCKKIRDKEQYWHTVESYISSHTEAQFSHSLCPDCLKELYPDLMQNKNDQNKG
jgi:hypothetical protein